MPSGLDAYYQASGRVGRDGEPADCTLLFLADDKAVQRFFTVGRYPAFDDVEATYGKLFEPVDGDRLDARLLQAALDRRVRRCRSASPRCGTSGSSRRRSSSLAVRRHALDRDAVVRLSPGAQQKRENDRRSLERMAFHGRTDTCRRQVLPKRIDVHAGLERCGACDNGSRIASVEEATDSGSADHVAVASAATPETPPAGPRAVQSSSTRGRVRVPRHGNGVVVDADAHHVTLTLPERRHTIVPHVLRHHRGDANDTPRLARRGRCCTGRTLGAFRLGNGVRP